MAIARIPSTASNQSRPQARPIQLQSSPAPGTPTTQRVLVRPRPPGTNAPSGQAHHQGGGQGTGSDGTPSRPNQNIILVNGQGTRVQRIPDGMNKHRSVSNLNGRTILIQNPQRSGSNVPGSIRASHSDSPNQPNSGHGRPMIRPIRVVQNSQTPNVASGGNGRPLLPINRGTPVQGQRIISVSLWPFSMMTGSSSFLPPIRNSNVFWLSREHP